MVNNYINTAIVLAGGKGTRLFPITKTKPKPLIGVGNYTMLEWCLFVLQKAGIENVIVVVKYLGKQIIDYVEEIKNSFPSMHIQIPDVDPKDTADAVRQVTSYLPPDCERFFVTMADIVTNIDLSTMASFHKEKKALTTISLKSIERPRSFGVIVLDPNSKITLFLEKPSPSEIYITNLVHRRKQSIHYHANLVNTGIYLFEKEIVDILHNFKELQDFGKHVFPFLLSRGMGIFGYSPPPEKDYYWMDCGTPEKLIWANYDVLKRWNWPYLPKGKEKEGSWFGKDVSIAENVTIQAPVAISDNCIIEKNVIIKPLTVIGKNCIIKKDTQLDGSIIRDNVTIGSHCLINSSFIAEKTIIGDNVTIEENTIIAENSKIHNQATIKVGTIIE